MGDYISQYQQLVCQYRSENASLRRQLAATRSGTATLREPQLIPQREPNRPATRTGPSSEQLQTPTPKLDLPDVPPLNQGSSVDMEFDRSSSIGGPRHKTWHNGAIFASLNELENSAKGEFPA